MFDISYKNFKLKFYISFNNFSKQTLLVVKHNNNPTNTSRCRYVVLVKKKTRTVTRSLTA